MVYVDCSRIAALWWACGCRDGARSERCGLWRVHAETAAGRTARQELAEEQVGDGRRLEVYEVPEELDLGQLKVVAIATVLSCLPQPGKPHEMARRSVHWYILTA